VIRIHGTNRKHKGHDRKHGNRGAAKPAKLTPISALERVQGAFIRDFEATTVSDLSELAYHPQGAPVLQLIIEMCPPGTADRMISALFGMGADSKLDTTMVYDAVGSHVAERAVYCASAELFLEMYNELFRGQLAVLVDDGCANFAVQTLLSRVDHLGLAKGVIQELLPHTGSMLQRGRGGVLHQLLLLCARLRVCQQEAIGALATALEQRALGAEDGEQSEQGSVRVLLDMSTLGSSILQAVMMFDGVLSKELVRAFTDQAVERAVELCKDPTHSHTIEAFYRSEALPKFKKKMTKSLLPTLCDLACDKFGSRVLEVIYKASEMEMKQKMVNVLASDESKLSANFYGRFVLRNCKVARYKEAGAEAWQQAEEASGKKKAQFEELFAGGEEAAKEEESSKEKKKRKRKEQAEKDGDEPPIEAGASKEIDDLFKEGGNADDPEPKKKKDKKKKHKEKEAEEQDGATAEDHAELRELVAAATSKKKKKKKAKVSESDEDSDDDSAKKKKKKKKAKSWAF